MGRALFIGSQSFQEAKEKLDCSIDRYNASIGDLLFGVNIEHLDQAVKVQQQLDRLTDRLQMLTFCTDFDSFLLTKSYFGRKRI